MQRAEARAIRAPVPIQRILWPAAAVGGTAAAVWLAATTPYTAHALGVAGMLLLVGGMIRLRRGGGRAGVAATGADAAPAGEAARLDRMAGLASEWLWETDTKLRFTYVSPRVRDLLGIEPAELIGRRFDDLRIAADGLPDWNVLLDELRARRRINGCRLSLLDGAGARRGQRLRAQPVFDADGAFAGYCGVGMDLADEVQAEQRLRTRDEEIGAQASELRLAQERLAGQAAHLSELTEKLTAARDKARQAEDALAGLGTFLGHEVRSAMNGILGMSGLLLGTRLDTAQDHYARSAIAAGEELLRLTDDMIDLSTIEAGALAFDIAEIDVAGAVEAAVRGLRVAAEEKGVELVSVVAPDLPADLRGDAGRLTQVLRGLICHAIRNGEGGVVTVSAAAEQEWVGGAVLTFEVTEPGGAFTAAARSGLLDPAIGLGAAGAQLAAGGPGGVKLITCQKLIAAMNGEAGVKARDGRGDTFWFRLPVCKHGASGAGCDEFAADAGPDVTPTADPDRSAA